MHAYPAIQLLILGAGEGEEAKKDEAVTSAFVPDLEAAIKVFVEKWQDHPEGPNALAQKHEPDQVRQELRPLVFEEVRLQVDEEMRVLLQNLKVRAEECMRALYYEHKPCQQVLEPTAYNSSGGTEAMFANASGQVLHS